MASAAVSDEGTLRMRPTPCGCTSALFSDLHRNRRICGEAATVPSATYFFCCARTLTLCRGRWRAQPSATKERYGCGPPLAGAHRPSCPNSPDCLFCGDTATVAPRAFVLTNSTSLALSQAAGLVRSVARPLQIANASLVCNLVPSVLPEKNGKKRGAWRRIILRADAREFLAAPRPERPLRAQNCYFPDSLYFRRMYYT